MILSRKLNNNSAAQVSCAVVCLAEIFLGSPVGELSAQPTEGFVLREKIKVKSEKKRWLCVAKH